MGKYMDHQQAIKVHAAERYLLDELSPEERDDFEAHYFMCVSCADEVRSAFTLADNARAVQAEEAERFHTKPAPSVPAWKTWLPSLAWLRPAIAGPVAACLLLGIALYQSMVVIPRLERDVQTATAPRVIPTVVAHAASRGDDPVLEIAERDRFVQVILDVNPLRSVSSYLCEIYDASGTLRFAVPAPPASKGGSLNLLLPASELNSGLYTIRVRPQAGTASETGLQADEYRVVLHRK